MKIIELEKTASTNDYCKKCDVGEDLCVFAKRQTAGRGTKGRSFISDRGGLYVTVMRHYENFPAESAFKIMVQACVAVCKTLKYFNINPVIRWANDVLVNGRKISGTLIENTYKNAYITRSIVGTGINVNNKIDSSIKDIAISMREAAGGKFDLEEVKKVYLNCLEEEYGIDDYRKYINWFGREVKLITEEKTEAVKAVGVTDEGRLLIERQGNIYEISAAEVSLKL